MQKRTLTFRPLTSVAVLVLVVAPFALAADKLPSGETIMDNFIKSTGGKAAYARVKNRVTKGQFSMPGSGMSMKFTKYESAPDNLYMRMEAEGMPGAVEQGASGGTAWMINPMGPQLMTGDQRDTFLREAVFLKDRNWRKNYKSVKCIELTDFDGKPCYKVEMTAAEGATPEFAYFEKGTWLRRGSETTMSSPMGEAKLVSKLKMYKEVDGVLIPHKIEQAVSQGSMTQNIELVFDSIEQNVDLPKERFALPAKIAEMVKAQADAEKKNKSQPDAKKD